MSNRLTPFRPSFYDKDFPQQLEEAIKTADNLYEHTLSLAEHNKGLYQQFIVHTEEIRKLNKAILRKNHRIEKMKQKVQELRDEIDFLREREEQW